MAAIKSDTLTFTIDGTERAAEAFSAKITKTKVEGEETFSEAITGGGYDWWIEGEATQSPGDAGSIWNLIFAATGTGESVPVVFRPEGNATPSASQPHFTGSVIIKTTDGDVLGGSASSGAERYKVPFRFKFTAKPTKVTSS